MTWPFNGAAPTPEHLKTSPGRFSGQDGGWMGLYINPVLMPFWEELKTHPNITYYPLGASAGLMIPAENR